MSEIKGFNDPFDGRAFFYNPKELENVERLKHCGGRLIDDFRHFERFFRFDQSDRKTYKKAISDGINVKDRSFSRKIESEWSFLYLKVIVSDGFQNR